MAFQFIDIDRIEGKEIDLVIKEKTPAEPAKNYVPSYTFNIVLHGTDIKAGGINLRVKHNDNTYYGGNIGYGVDEEHRGHHYASKACLLVKEAAIAHGLDYLIITCDPENIASRKTCEYLGAELLEIAMLPEDNEMYLEGKRIKCRYRWDLQPGYLKGN